MLNIDIAYGAEARRKILKGASKVGKIVGASLGPFGRNAIIKTKYSAPQIHGDGVTIARHIMLKDEIEDLGAQTLIEGAMKADDRVGDGTTTTTVIASKIVKEYGKKIEEEDKSYDTGTTEEGGGIADVNKMAREILDTGKDAVEKLQNELSRPLEKKDLKSVIKSSLGTLFTEHVDEITDVVEAVGKDGFISVEDNYATQYGIDTELIKGMRFKGTYATPYMMTNKKLKEAVYEDVPVIVCNSDIASTTQLGTVLKQFVKKGERRLVIIANKFEAPFVKLMASTVVQARQGNTQLIDFLCIKAPSLTTEQYEDVAVYCDAKFFDKNEETSKLKDGNIAHLGFAKKVVVNDREVIMIGGQGKVDERVEMLKAQAKKEADPAFKKQTERRIGALQSGFAIIRVGAVTEGERVIAKKKIEDSYRAGQAAMKEGVVAGGGLALKTIAEGLGEEHPMYIPFMEPYNLIQKSAGGKLKIPDTVLDPLLVIRIAVETACSTAASLITAEVGIAEKSPDLVDQLSNKLFPQNEVDDDFRQEHEDEGGFN